MDKQDIAPPKAEPPSVAASSGVAVAAARAAAAAKAVANAKASAVVRTPASSSASASASAAALAAASAAAAAAAAAAAPKTATPVRPTIAAPANSRINAAGPEVFSMSIGDDCDDSETSPGRFNTIPLQELSPDQHVEATETSQSGRPAASDSLLNEAELEDYEQIEESFQKFKERQREVEANVAELLNRLNTRIQVPSSVASSECGDLTSMASSEWDTESLGPTEDGLSLLGSPLNSPREQGPLERAVAASSSSGQSWPLKPADWQASHMSSDKPKEGFGKSASSGADPNSFTPRDGGCAGGGTGPLGGERGDLLGNKRNNNASQSPSHFAQQPVEQAAGPRLTPQLLAAQDQNSIAVSPGSRGGGVADMGTASQDAAVANRAQAPGVRLTPQLLAAQDAPSSASQAPFGRPASGGMGLAAGSFSAGMGAEDEELSRWQGWTVVATPEGRLFFHNEPRQLSQWHQPDELREVLGEWEQIEEESSGETGQRVVYWRNDLLRLSLWKDPRHTTNIFQAALDGNIFFMQLYAEVEGQLNVVDPKGRCALHYACAGGATQSVLLLVQRQAEVDRRDEAFATPLIFACRYGYASVVKVLLDARANLDAEGEGGNTALHEAASMGQLDCVHLLLLFGANATVVNTDRDAPVDVAARKRHVSCVTLLRRHVQPLTGHTPASSTLGSPSTAGAGAKLLAPTPLSVGGAPLVSGFGATGAPGAAMPCGGAILEMPSTTSSGETDPFAGGSSSEVPATGYASQQQNFAPGGGCGYMATQTPPHDASSAPAGHRGGVAAGAGAPPRRGRRRRAGERPRVEYVGSSSEDSELDAVAEAYRAGAGEGSDGPSSSDNSDVGANGRRRSNRRKRGGGRRRERSPVALGLLQRMQWAPRWLGSLRRAFGGPIRADLGEPNRYRYNEDTQRWELTEGDQDNYHDSVYQ